MFRLVAGFVILAIVWRCLHLDVLGISETPALSNICLVEDKGFLTVTHLILVICRPVIFLIFLCHSCHQTLLLTKNLSIILWSCSISLAISRDFWPLARRLIILLFSSVDKSSLHPISCCNDILPNNLEHLILWNYRNLITFTTEGNMKFTNNMFDSIILH